MSQVLRCNDSSHPYRRMAMGRIKSSHANVHVAFVPGGMGRMRTNGTNRHLEPLAQTAQEAATTAEWTENRLTACAIASQTSSSPGGTA